LRKCFHVDCPASSSLRQVKLNKTIDGYTPCEIRPYSTKL
jgi:hypothetical protein